MSEKYRPAGSNVEYTVPTLDEPADGPKGFRDFADSIPKDLSPVVQISKKTAAYTLLAADSGSVVSMDTSAGDLIVTLPVNSPTFLAPVGAVIVVANAGKVRGKKVTVVAASGVTLRDSAVRTVELYRMVSLIQVEKDSWIINAGTGGTPAPGVPSAPKLDTAVAGPANITVTWSKPVDDGGSPLTGYTVETSVDAGKNWVIGGAVGPTVLSDVLDGLTPSAVYQVRVKAANTNGFGDPSNVLTATPTQPFNNAGGGTITQFNKDGKLWRRHVFTASSSLTVIAAPVPFIVTVVGGGGGGGAGPDGFGTAPSGGPGGFYSAPVEFTVGDKAVSVSNGGGDSGCMRIGGGGCGIGGQGGASSIAGGWTAGGGKGGGGYGCPQGAVGTGSPSPAADGGVTARDNAAHGLPSNYGNGGSGAQGPYPSGPCSTAGTQGAVIVEYQIGDTPGEVSVKKMKKEEVFSIARVTRVNNVVVNIEVATDAWLAENDSDPFFFFVKSPDVDGNNAVIGSYYSPESKLFEKLLIGPVA